MIKTVDDSTPAEGQTIHYTVTVTNNGPAEATGISLEDILPGGLDNEIVTPGAGTSWSEPTWTIGTLSNGSSATLDIQVTVELGMAGFTITNPLTDLALDQTDNDVTPDTLSVDITVNDNAPGTCNIFVDQDSWLNESAPDDNHGGADKLKSNSSAGDAKHSVSSLRSLEYSVWLDGRLGDRAFLRRE